MTAQAITSAPGRVRQLPPAFDGMLVVCALLLLGLGLVMVASASISIAERQTGEPFYFLYRQGAFVAVGVLIGTAVLRMPLVFWERVGPIALILAMGLLIALFLPGVGRTVNGSTRWIAAGPINLQVSELAKLALIVYLAGYLVRHGEAVRATIGGFLIPMAVVGLFGLLLLAQPDFGAAVVMVATALAMMFLGGVRLWLFGVLVLLAGGVLGLLAISSPYRLQRLTAFVDPWADPFNSGFQLTQALIAFGRGDWLGVGLGASVQKLFYLPEAHTDFVFAVLGEELGLAGALTVVLLFGILVWRAFLVGRNAHRAGQPFGGHVAYGIAAWVGLQAFINLGVNMGLLPTKGLTLPLMSYGGSSMLVTCAAMALLLRVDFETRRAQVGNGAAR